MSDPKQTLLGTVPEPIPMLLYCPICGVQHVDASEPPQKWAADPSTEYVWNNPPHRSHLCHNCGCIWRPADVPTTGVKTIETKGKNDNWVVRGEVKPAAPEAQPTPEPPQASAPSVQVVERGLGPLWPNGDRGRGDLPPADDGYVPQFNPSAECSPTLTQCPRCNNPHHACDKGLGGAEPLIVAIIRQRVSNLRAAIEHERVWRPSHLEECDGPGEPEERIVAWEAEVTALDEWLVRQ